MPYESNDPFSDIMTDYIAQLKTLADPYFPESEGLPAGWQVSEDDTTPMSGGDYFITLRPGPFANPARNAVQENQWHIQTILYMRFAEYKTAWSLFRVFRGAVLALRKTAPLQAHGVYDQTFIAADQAGYLVDGQGNYTDIVVQTLDCTIFQKILQNRQL
jgi:hypothetical protein